MALNLSILLPAVSPRTDRKASEKYVEELLSAAHDILQSNPASNVICGMDALDPASRILANKLVDSTRLHCYIFQEEALQKARQAGLQFCGWMAKASNRRYSPLCWMWQELALYAERTFQPEAFVLLGDDIKITPVGWVEQVLGVLLDQSMLFKNRLQL